MESSEPPRVLVVANRTAATPELIDAVRERAGKGPASFTLLVPQQTGTIHRLASTEEEHTDPSEADTVLALAVPLLEQAAGGPVEGMTGDPDPLTAIQDAVNIQGYDEIIVSTLPARVSRWLKLDLPHKLEGLGLPVTHVEAGDTPD